MNYVVMKRRFLNEKFCTYVESHEGVVSVTGDGKGSGDARH